MKSPKRTLDGDASVIRRLSQQKLTMLDDDEEDSAAPLFAGTAGGGGGAASSADERDEELKEESAEKAEEDIVTTEEEARQKAEEEAKGKEEEEAKAKAKAEEEAKLNVEEEAKAKAEEEAKLKVEEESKAKAEEEAKLKVEEESKAKAEEEAKIKAEEEARWKAEEEAKQAKSATRIQAVVRSMLCRAQVMKMIEDMIANLQVVKEQNAKKFEEDKKEWEEKQVLKAEKLEEEVRMKRQSLITMKDTITTDGWGWGFVGPLQLPVARLPHWWMDLAPHKTLFSEDFEDLEEEHWNFRQAYLERTRKG
jgi:chemotaxis protein histidine kinase CheA